MENEVQNEDIFRGVGVEVKLKSQDDFESSRNIDQIGIASKKEKKIISVLSYFTQARKTLFFLLKNCLNLTAKKVISMNLI